MIDEAQARALVRAAISEHYGSLGDVELSLSEFTDGWLVHVRSGAGHRGSPVFTVDAADGSVRVFPSHIPPTRVVAQYAELKAARPALGAG